MNDQWTHEEGQLAVDCIETPTHMIIRAAIAGVKEEDITVNVTEDVVTIRGERHIAKLPPGSTMHYSECFWGPFSRTIVAPCRLRGDEAEAMFVNSILTVTIPKATQAVTVRITSA